jgi:phospholipase/lecithinase/hemolysin
MSGTTSVANPTLPASSAGSTGAAPGGGGSGGTSVGVSTSGVTLPTLPPQYSTGNLGFFTRNTESVPTSITVGPDGALYVGELTGIPYPDGYASVIRIADPTATTGYDGTTPSGVPQVYASGFTQIQSVGFDAKGDMYVLEYVNANTVYDPTQSVTSLPPSLLIKVAPDGVRTTISGPELKLGNYLLVDKSTGDVFVSTNNASTDSGEVLRYHTDAANGAVTSTVVASGLANPRGLSFGPDGNLYVLNTGDGTPASSPDAATAPVIPFIPGLVSERGGYTGSITRVDITSPAGGQQTILTGLPNFREFDPTTGQDRVISEGANGLTITPDGTAYVASGGGLAPQTAVAVGALGDNLQGVLKITGLFGANPAAATVTPAFNSLTYAAANGPDGATTLFNTESNLNDITLGSDGKLYAVDAARNDVYGLTNGGTKVDSVTVIQKQPPVLTPPQYAAVVAAGGNPTADYQAEIASTTTKNADSLPNTPGDNALLAANAAAAAAAAAAAVTSASNAPGGTVATLPPTDPTAATSATLMGAATSTTGTMGAAVPTTAAPPPAAVATPDPSGAVSSVVPVSATPNTMPPPHGEDAGPTGLPTVPNAGASASPFPGPVDPVSPPVLPGNTYAPYYNPFFGNFAPAASDPLVLSAGANGHYTASNVINFGDRLADDGSVAKLLGLPSPATAAPYSPTGDFTDGPKWTTDLAQALGAHQTDAQTNFAYENATAQSTFNPMDPVGTLLDFQGQVNLFQATDHTFSATDLATVTFGGNDLTFPSNVAPETTVTLTVKAITDGLHELANLGAKHFLVTNLPDVTLAPLFSDPKFLAATGATQAGFQGLVNDFNTQLAASLATFKTQTGLDVKTLDLHALFNGIAANPSAYGFSNISQPILANPPTTGSMPAYNPAVVGKDPQVQHSSLFLDPYFDPTALGQAIVAQTARTMLT